jgi:hypothetical protein
MSERRQFFILAITQAVGTAIVLLIAGILNDANVYGEKFCQMWVLAAFTLIITGTIVLTKPVCRHFQMRVTGISVDNAVWVAYFMDLAVLDYLIYKSGGIGTSPFSSFLIYLATNGIVLGQRFRTVFVYYLLVIVCSVVLTFWVSGAEPDPERILYHRSLVGVTFLCSLLIPLAGYATRHLQLPTSQDYSQVE